jgi:UDP-N-acetylmuramoyl-tripeptide--D-alanyl-D-alanine ligase
MSALTFAEFATACGARWRGVPVDSSARFSPSTDSRTLAPGEAFVALRGPSFDGNAFAAAALARGCSALVLDNETSLPDPCPVPYMIVGDAKAAYLAGATAARRDAPARVVGITGSTGKTTTKSMTAQLLAPAMRVLVTPQNENNELGVAKLCYKMDESADVAIVEMGARHPGEIAQLVDIAMPDVGVLTNIGEAHLEYFEDRADLARTKFALFGRGARAVCSAADEWTRMLAAEAGIDRAAMWVRLQGDPQTPGLAIEAGLPRDGRVPVTLGASHSVAEWHLAGEHHLRDALLAVGAAVLCGMSFERAIAGLAGLHLPEGRFELHPLPSGATCVYDAYNASPTSMAYALRAFADLPSRRRIAVLGSMAELGADASAMHEATGAAAARVALDMLYCGGPFAEQLMEGARRAGMTADMVARFESNEEIAHALRASLGGGDTVLLKGSRVQRMEEILHMLLAAGKRAS